MGTTFPQVSNAAPGRTMGCEDSASRCCWGLLRGWDWWGSSWSTPFPLWCRWAC